MNVLISTKSEEIYEKLHKKINYRVNKDQMKPD